MNHYTLLALREITTELINPQPGMEPINFEFLINPQPARLYSQMELGELHGATWTDPLRNTVDDAVEEACRILLKAMYDNILNK